MLSLPALAPSLEDILPSMFSADDLEILIEVTEENNPINSTDTRFVDDVLAEFPLTGEDHQLLIRFVAHLEFSFQQNFRDNQLIRERFNFFTLADEFNGIDRRRLEQDKSPLLPALWVIFLRVLRKNLNHNSLFKYKELQDFVDAYEHVIPLESICNDERMRLFKTANWMNIFVGMVPAKKSKCLATTVIPKLLEGYSVKYILGSGQTRATKHRVIIFEHEGGHKPCKKPKRAIAKRSEANRANVSECTSLKRQLSSDSLELLLQSPRTVESSAENPFAGLSDLSDEGDKDIEDFKALHSTETLAKISQYIRHHEDWSAKQKWYWMRKTTQLPASSFSRESCLNMLSRLVEKRRISELTAVEEMMVFDETATQDLATKQDLTALDEFFYADDGLGRDDGWLNDFGEATGETTTISATPQKLTTALHASFAA